MAVLQSDDLPVPVDLTWVEGKGMRSQVSLESLHHRPFRTQESYSSLTFILIALSLIISGPECLSVLTNMIRIGLIIVKNVVNFFLFLEHNYIQQDVTLHHARVLL